MNCGEPTLNTPAGLAFLRPSPWDEQVLGRKTYIIDGAFLHRQDDRAAMGLISAVTERLIAEGVAFAVWRIGGLLDWFEACLVRQGWRVSDRLVVFLATPKAGHNQAGEVRPFETRDALAVRAITRQTLTHGRIQDDPAFTDEVKVRFVEAIAQSLMTQTTTLVSTDNENQTVGFIDGDIDPFTSEARGEREGSLSLIAVSPANVGRGCGRALYQAFMGRMHQAGATRVEICTQFDNSRALAFYGRAGAKPSGSIATFHWHRRDVVAESK